MKAVYKGNQLVWSSEKKSYAILTDNTRISFDPDSTPLDNFTVWETDGSISVNNISVLKSTVKELFFSEDYINETMLPNNFCRNLQSLTNINLIALSNVVRIGDLLLSGCIKLTQLELPASTLIQIGNSFLYNCRLLTQLTMRSFQVPTAISTNFLYNTLVLTTILVPQQSVQAYKTTAPWSSHAIKITGY